MIDKKMLLGNLKKLVSVPSISGTEDELKAAFKIKELICEIPYFAEHNEDVFTVPIKDDPFGRVIVGAFLPAKEKTSETIILTGHYDVVDAEEFGSLKDIAFDVDAITERIGELPISDEVKTDLESGNYIFGRGTLDMKYGHALSIELLRHYSETRELNGNILYVGVCGEETNSEGMLAAVSFFVDFAEERELTYKCFLLTEGYMVDGQEEGVKYIQYGNAGKVMPMFFCVGKTTHGEEPLLGLDANIMSGEVYRIMHANPSFCQSNHGITTAVPCGLKMQDLKDNYSLSTTLFAASYYNIATISLNPDELMKKLIAIGEEAFENVISIMDDKVKAYEKICGKKPEYYQPKPCVVTFAEYFKQVASEFEGDFEAHCKDKLVQFMKENPEMQDACVKLVKYMAGISKDKLPKIIVSILPPYYPDVTLDEDNADVKAMLDCIDDVIGYAADEYKETLEVSEYYGISDMSYTWLAEGMDYDTIFDNLVGINSIYQFPKEKLKQFKVPGMVLGCAGKDMHKYTERLEKHYNFDVLPQLYTYAIEKFIG